MATAPGSVSDVALGAVTGGLRIFAMVAVWFTSGAISILASGAIFIPLDRTLQAHAPKANPFPNNLAYPGMVLGFILWFLTLVNIVKEHVSAWDNLIHFAEAAVSTLVCTGALSTILCASVHVYRLYKKAVAKRQARAEHVELAQARHPSELERMVAAEDGEDVARSKSAPKN